MHQWSRTFGTPFSDRIWDLSILPDGKYLAAGFSAKNASDSSPRNGFVARLNATGQVEEALLIGANDTVTTTFTGIGIAGNDLIANGFSYIGNPRGAGIVLKTSHSDFSQNCGSLVSMPGAALTAVDSAGILVQDGGNSDEPVSNSADNNLVSRAICLITGTDLMLNSPEIRLWPNPGNGLYRIQNLPPDQGVQAVVFTAQGKECWTGQINENQLDLRHLPDGLFYLTLQGTALRKTISISKQAQK